MSGLSPLRTKLAVCGIGVNRTTKPGHSKEQPGDVQALGTASTSAKYAVRRSQAQIDLQLLLALPQNLSPHARTQELSLKKVHSFSAFVPTILLQPLCKGL